MILPTLFTCSLLLGAALAKPGSANSRPHSLPDASPAGQQPQPLSDGRDEEFQPLHMDAKSLMEPIGDEKRVYVLRSGLYFFTSPGYPSNYRNNQRKSWLIFGNRRQELSINCNPRNDFDIEGHRFCSHDYLKINFSKYCNGRSPPNTIRSRVLRVRFRSDGSITGKGFYCLLTVP